MSTVPPSTSPLRLPLRRLFWLPLGLSALLVVLVLVGLVALSWRSLERLRPVQEHLDHIGRIQEAALNMEHTLLQGLSGTRVDRAALRNFQAKVTAISAQGQHLHTDSRERMRAIEQRLARTELDPRESLFQTLAQLRQVLADELKSHDALLAAVNRDAQTELRLALILLIILPLVVGGLLGLLRLRIRRPLNDLGQLLNRLAERDYQPVPRSALNDTAGLIQPLLRSYNALTERLQALEREHVAREHTLEQEVRQATRALLWQSRELAKAERLAAVGAVSAGLAHELRNPLAGVQMACGKLQRQLRDSAQSARITAVIAELKRVNNLLNETLDAARHAPESPVPVHLARLVTDLLDLMRYQVPPGVRLHADIPSELCCLLPEAGLRQALLNLLLNAVQALGKQGEINLGAEGRNDQLFIQVRDDGLGFPAEMLRVGVRPFATNRVDGTGLGLAMVRRFTRELDGDIELANLETGGAQVTLRLPCAD